MPLWGFFSKAAAHLNAFSKKLASRQGAASRKGITMVEVAISLTVIAIVSGAAALMSVQSANIEARAITTAYVEGYAESVVECFFASEDDADFKEALAVLDKSFDKNGRFEISDETGGTIYEISGMGFRMSIDVEFASRAISIVAIDNDNRIVLRLSHNVGDN